MLIISTGVETGSGRQRKLFRRAPVVDKVTIKCSSSVRDCFDRSIYVLVDDICNLSPNWGILIGLEIGVTVDAPADDDRIPSNL